MEANGSEVYAFEGNPRLDGDLIHSKAVVFARRPEDVQAVVRVDANNTEPSVLGHKGSAWRDSNHFGRLAQAKLSSSPN